ncbi:lipolytic enzyme, G-D-S-L [Acidisarcina polymorpha]|uniref:Lipolytic enzyme, G-D-S-L n=1 Tax=Acidisarcina polymorpha TaxID=2211140 RepID=A0A2Z5FSN8_9BACT|nr:lipolytic enzyme, G-D-S-L [Acidisarcina polymorpha]
MKYLTLLLTLAFAARLTAQTTQPKPPPPVSQQVAHMEDQLADWPQLKRYQADNAALPPPAPGQPRVVFYGDSITDGWGRQPNTGEFFPGKPYVNRGISGQTTPQMLVRFQQDVVHLHPAAVLILAGTNDIAGNTGPSTPQMTEDNFTSMAEIARQNGIKVILASITPAYSYPWKPGVDPVPTIKEINSWLKDYCAKEGFTYVNYYSAMADEKGAMKPGLAKDGVHPTAEGYAVMGPLAEAAIAKALQ